MMTKFTQKPGVVVSFRTPMWDHHHQHDHHYARCFNNIDFKHFTPQSISQSICEHHEQNNVVFPKVIRRPLPWLPWVERHKSPISSGIFFRIPLIFFPLQRLATSALLYDWSLTDSDIDTTGSRKLTNGIFCQRKFY